MKVHREPDEWECECDCHKHGIPISQCEEGCMADDDPRRDYNYTQNLCVDGVSYRIPEFDPFDSQ